MTCFTTTWCFFCLTAYKKRSLDEPILHTPFCGKACVFDHHKILIDIINCTNHRSDDQNHATECAFAIREYVKSANPSQNLPDPLVQCPILHIVAMLGKVRVLDKLARMPEFDFGIRMEPTGETALHKMIPYLDKAMKEPSRRCCLVKIKETFRVALARLINVKPELFVLQDNRGDTPFHSTVRCMLRWHTAHKTGKRQDYFAFCLKSMICLLRSFDAGQMLQCSTRDVLCMTNKHGENFVQMLDKISMDNAIVGSVYDELGPKLLKEIRQGSNSKEGHEPSLETKKQRLDELIGQLREANEQKKEDTKEEIISCDSDSEDLPLSPPSELYDTMESEAEPMFGNMSETDGETRFSEGLVIASGRATDKSSHGRSRQETALNSPTVETNTVNGHSFTSDSETQRDSQNNIEQNQIGTASNSEKESSVSVAGAILQCSLPDTEKRRLIMETLQGFERKSSEQDMILLNERKRRFELTRKTREEQEEVLVAASEKRRKLLEETEKLERDMRQLEQELQTTKQEEQERCEAYQQAQKKCHGYMFQVDECRSALESLKH